MKKLFSNIPKITSKLFIKKLRKIRINKNKYERIKTDLKKAKNDLLEQNKSQVLNKKYKIYKIYANHKIRNMLNTLNHNLIKKRKPLYAKEFLKKLYSNEIQIFAKKKQYKYGNQIKSIYKPKSIKLNFKKK